MLASNDPVISDPEMKCRLLTEDNAKTQKEKMQYELERMKRPAASCSVACLPH